MISLPYVAIFAVLTLGCFIITHRIAFSQPRYAPPEKIIRILEWERMGYDENSIGWGGGGKGLIDSVVQMEKRKLVQFLKQM